METRSVTDPALLPHRHVSLHLIGDEAVLFDQARQVVYSANTGATFIWCCLGEGMGADEIAARLERQCDLPAKTAAHYVSEMLEQWRHLGLLGGADDDGRQADRAAWLPIGPAPAGLPPPVRRHHYRLLDTGFTLGYGTAELAERVHFTLAHLSCPAGPGTSELQLVAHGGRFALVMDGQTLETCRELRQVVPMIKAQLAYLVLDRSRDLCAIHAAAVARDGRAMLLPAASGSGKSTLTAALVHAGFTYLGDDTTVLDEGPRVRPMPFSLCLKAGAWAVLADRLPALAAQPVELRGDGKLARYLPPPAGGWAPPDSRLPVEWLVFPHYRPDATARLIPLDKPTALKTVLPACYTLAGPLDTALLDRLVEWIEGLPCYRLELSALDPAIALLEELWR